MAQFQSHYPQRTLVGKQYDYAIPERVCARVAACTSSETLTKNAKRFHLANCKRNYCTSVKGRHVSLVFCRDSEQMMVVDLSCSWERLHAQVALTTVIKIKKNFSLIIKDVYALPAQIDSMYNF